MTGRPSACRCLAVAPVVSRPEAVTEGILQNVGPRAVSAPEPSSRKRHFSMRPVLVGVGQAGAKSRSLMLGPGELSGSKRKC